MSNQRNKRWALSITYTTLSTIVATPIFALLPLTTQQVSARSNYYQESKVAICHRTNSVKNPYVEVHIDKHAYDGENKSGHKGKHTGKTVKSEKEARELKSQKTKWGDIYISEVSRNEKNVKVENCEIEQPAPVKEHKKEEIKEKKEKIREDCKEDPKTEEIKDVEQKPEEQEEVVVSTPEVIAESKPQVLAVATEDTQKLANTGSNPWINILIGIILITSVGMLFKREQIKSELIS